MSWYLSFKNPEKCIADNKNIIENTGNSIKNMKNNNE